MGNMNFNPEMSEIEFIEEIDALFQFDTEEEYEQVTRIACKISDNAALMVGLELASLSSNASQEVNLKLLEIMKTMRPTPVVLASLPVIRALLKEEEPSAEITQNLLKECRGHDNAWNGLGILECADESLHEVCEKIRNSYKSPR